MLIFPAVVSWLCPHHTGTAILLMPNNFSRMFQEVINDVSSITSRSCCSFCRVAVSHDRSNRLPLRVPKSKILSGLGRVYLISESRIPTKQDGSSQFLSQQNWMFLGGMCHVWTKQRHSSCVKPRSFLCAHC